MKIVRGYKGRVVGERYKRKYVVPDNGLEANNFRNYMDTISDKTEEWLCDYIGADGKKVSGTVVVFRFVPQIEDSRLISLVSKGMAKAVEKGIGSVKLEAADPESKVALRATYNKRVW